MTAGFTESIVEDAARGWLAALGYEIKLGPTIAAGEPGAERRDPGYRDVVLERWLREAFLPKLISSELPVTRTDRLLEPEACIERLKRWAGQRRNVNVPSPADGARA